MGSQTTESKRGKGIDPTVVERIASDLGETAGQALGQIRGIMRVLGEERARQLVQQAKAVEVQGGLLVPDGSRRRTLGGVFFKLARDQASPAERDRIWLPKNRRPKPKAAATEASPSPYA